MTEHYYPCSNSLVSVVYKQDFLRGLEQVFFRLTQEICKTREFSPKLKPIFSPKLNLRKILTWKTSNLLPDSSKRKMFQLYLCNKMPIVSSKLKDSLNSMNSSIFLSAFKASENKSTKSLRKNDLKTLGLPATALDETFASGKKNLQSTVGFAKKRFSGLLGP